MATSNKAASVVTVACKLPHGLVLQLAQAADVREPVMGGGSREVKQWRKFGEQVTVYGIAHPQNAAPLCMIVGGYALTPGVNADFWDAWLAQNKEHATVKSGMIFAYDKAEDTQAQAKEFAGKRSGMERLDPAKLPKGVKPAKEKETEAV